MLKRIAVWTLIVSVLSLNTVRADDELTKTVNQIGDNPVAEALALGHDVHNVKLNRHGEVDSLLIVGKADITQALSPSKAEILATRRARNDARRNFVRWLNDDLNFYEKEGNEIIVVEEGSTRDGELQQSGKALNDNSDKFNAASKGLLQGLELIAKKVDDKNHTLSLVYGWSAETYAAAKKLNRKSQPVVNKPDTANSGRKPTGVPAKSKDVKLESKTIITKRAKRYF